MSAGTWISFGALILGFIGAILGAMRYLVGLIGKVADADEKRVSRVYERFDEYKKHIEDNVDSKFVHRDLCNNMHTNNSQNLAEFKAYVMEAFKTLDIKIDKLVDKFIGN
jgi:hypothetical protein